MTPTVMGQKVEEILQICKKLLKRHPSNEHAHEKNGDPEGNGNSGTKIPIREAPHESEHEHPKNKKRFGDEWTISDRIQLSLSILTALAVGSGVWANLQTKTLVKTAQDTYEITNRPYIGPNGGTIGLLQNNNEKTPYGITIKSEVKNYGTAPGEDFVFTWEPRINGVPLLIKPKHGVPYTLFPGETASLSGNISGHRIFDPIMSGKYVLEVNLTIEYKGISKQYRYCERQQYDPSFQQMLTMGPVCDKPWAQGPAPAIDKLTTVP